MQKTIQRFTQLFPLWAVIFSVSAFFKPAFFTGLKDAIVPLLAIIMIGMGMMLSAADFKRVFRQPRAISLGIFLQFALMPLAAVIISKILGLPVELTTGMVLLGACPGGTASNVITYLAGGNLALSITMTSFSTLLAVIATPTLTWLYVGQSVPVPIADMLLSILKIIIIPVTAGLAINTFFAAKLRPVKNVFPLISVIAIVVIIAIVVALNQQKIQTMGFIVITAVILHNMSGLIGGYWIPRALKMDEKTCRTIAIEVAMQNSGLSVALAVKYFSALAALPGALFSIWHNLSGSLLAGYWSTKNHAGR